MRKVKTDDTIPEFKPEDLGKGVRGKYYERYKKGTNLVLLSPDVAKAFPTEEAVNEALRSLMEVARKSVRPTRRSTGHTDKPHPA